MHSAFHSYYSVSLSAQFTCYVAQQGHSVFQHNDQQLSQDAFNADTRWRLDVLLRYQKAC